MALFGGDVKTIPYQSPDYSGSVDAARGLANARAQGIAGGIGQVTDYFKQQGEKKKLIKQSDIQIDAALKLFPDLAPTLQGVRDQIKDENISLNERAGIAESVAGLINMGTKQMQADAEFGLKKRQLDIEEGQGIESALIARDKMRAAAGNLKLEKIDAGNRKDVPVLIDEAGNMFSTQNKKPIVDINAYASGSGGVSSDTTGAGPLPPLDFPQEQKAQINSGMVLPSGQENVPTPDPGFDYNQTPTIPGDEAQGGTAANIQASLDMNAPIPLGQPMPSDKAKSKFRIATSGEAFAYGVPAGQIDDATGRFYPTNAPTGMTFEQTPEGGFRLIQGPGVGGGGAKAEAAKETQKEQSFERSRGIIGAAADSINMIKSDLSENSVIARAQQGLSIALPATTEGRIAKNLETVKILNSKEEVNKMRAASPTGSAGGNITENEWKIFQNNFGTLEVGMYPPDLVSNLQKTSLNQFEAVNGRPEDVIKLFNNGKITKPVFDEYLKEYKQARKILGILDTGTGGPGDDWTKYNSNLLRFDKEKQSQLNPKSQEMQDKLDAIRSKQ